MDLKKTLYEDEQYQRILSAMPERERQQVESDMKNFIEFWEKHFFQPIEEKLQDPEVAKEFSNIVEKQIDK